LAAGILMISECFCRLWEIPDCRCKKFISSFAEFFSNFWQYYGKTEMRFGNENISPIVSGHTGAGGRPGTHIGGGL
jgi:hypothetical protein